MDHNNLYNSDNFNLYGKELIDLLSKHLGDSTSGTLNTLPYKKPEEMLSLWEDDYRSGKIENPLPLFKKILDNALNLYSPRNVGHQISVPIPESILGGLVELFLNNSGAGYEGSMVGNVMERIITNDLSKKLGFPKETYGFITAGATLATFTALLTARSVKASQNVWKEGSYKLGVMVSEQAHYSVDRAAKIMGLGESGVIKIPTNTDYQMDTSKLNEIFEKTKAAGIEVFAIVGSACSTATGSFDNLLEIASFAEQNNLWFHVDGAHGGGLAFSEKFKSLVAGISKADSVAMDFHKMLLVPSLATALLYKNYKDSYKTFSQNASYLYEEIDEDWQNMGKRTFECTKPASVFRAYTALKTKGLDTMIKTTEYLYDLGIAFGKILEENPLFEIPVKPAGNIVCFRIKDENANELNQKIRQKLLEEGKYFVVSTKLENQFYLRVSIMNPLTTINTLTELLEDIKTIADRLRTN